MTDRLFFAVVLACVLTAVVLLVDLICHVSTGQACAWPWLPPDNPDDDGLVLPP